MTQGQATLPEQPRTDGAEAQAPPPLAASQPSPDASAPLQALPAPPPYIDPAKVAIYLMSYRRQPNRYQQSWLDALRARGPSGGSGQGYLIRYGSEEYGIPEAREQNCNRFLAEDAPAGREYLLMIDADIVPLPRRSPLGGEAGPVSSASDGQGGTAALNPGGTGSDDILRDNGPLVYCGYAGHDVSAGHFGDDQFGAGFCRIHASVLRRIAKPWWRMVFQDDRRVMCECSHFRLKAEAVGIKPHMVGVAGHEASVITVPRSLTQIGILLRPHLARLLAGK
jgi:hypothetical protein